MRTSALFGGKNFEFVEIYSVSTRTRGGGKLCGQGRGSIFRDFVRTSFMDGPFVYINLTAKRVILSYS